MKKKLSNASGQASVALGGRLLISLFVASYLAAAPEVKAQEQPAAASNSISVSTSDSTLAANQGDADAEGSSPVVFRSEDEVHRIRLFLGGEYFRLSLGDGKSLSTIGVGVGAAYAVTSKVGLVVSTTQTTLPDAKFADLFTAFGLGVSYAVTGQMTYHEVAAGEGRDTMVHYQEHAEGGLRANLGLSQYFFNAQSGSLSFAGLYGSLSYELPLGDAWGVSGGAGVEHLSNGGSLMQPVRAFLRGWVSL